MGALEAARTAQRLSAAPVAIERRRPAHPAAPAPTPATRTSFLETVFACSRLSYIMRSSVVAEYLMNEGFDSTVYDDAGGNNGTLNGGSSWSQAGAEEYPCLSRRPARW